MAQKRIIFSNSCWGGKSFPGKHRRILQVHAYWLCDHLAVMLPQSLHSRPQDRRAVALTLSLWGQHPTAWLHAQRLWSKIYSQGFSWAQDSLGTAVIALTSLQKSWNSQLDKAVLLMAKIIPHETGDMIFVHIGCRIWVLHAGYHPVSVSSFKTNSLYFSHNPFRNGC